MASDWKVGPTVLRIALGLLFIVPGLTKLMAPSGVIGMLGSLGFPAPAFWGWLLLLSEIIFGLALVFGFKVKWTVWPLVIVLLVATFTVYVPKLGTPEGNPVQVLFHLLGMAGLVSLFFTGPGRWAVKG